MKLGQKVSFKTEYVKAGDFVDEENATQEQLENEFTLKKLTAREHEAEREGIICGKRNYAVENQMEYIQNEHNDDFQFITTGQTFESFYLVASTMNRFHRVKKDDVKVVEA